MIHLIKIAEDTKSQSNIIPSMAASNSVHAFGKDQEMPYFLRFSSLERHLSQDLVSGKCLTIAWLYYICENSKYQQ